MNTGVNHKVNDGHWHVIFLINPELNSNKSAFDRVKSIEKSKDISMISVVSCEQCIFKKRTTDKLIAQITFRFRRWNGVL